MSKSLKQTIILIMSISILGMQVMPGYGAISKKEIPRVAFLGIHFEGVDSNKQSVIRSQVAALIGKEEQLYKLSEDEINSAIDESLREKVLRDLQQEDIHKVAEKLDADHIFAGNIENQSKTEDATALVGTVIRYDRSTGQLYELGIKTFFESFLQELARIDQQLVQTIVGEKRKGFFARHLPGILIIAATVLAAALLIGDTGGQGSGGSGGQRPPFTAH